MRLNNFVVIISVAFVLCFLFQPRMRLSRVWRATVTPLASIIGSGFLISGPLFILSVGMYAPLAMLTVVIVGYMLGSSIRLNILNNDLIRFDSGNKKSSTYYLEHASKLMLAFAYIVSITFYLKLLSVFFLTGINIDTPLNQKFLTTFFLVFIGVTGKIRGLSILESLETYSVNVKIAIIIALLVSHIGFNFNLFYKGVWELTVLPHEESFTAIRKILGSLIIIQGFETSRYLGSAYSPELRIRTMKNAQLIAGVIYIVFITSTLAAFNEIHDVNASTVIDVCRMIAPVLPWLLIIAAVMSQFSAAVADTIGSGGLFYEVLGKKFTLNSSYLVVSILGIILSWVTNIYSIISYASKAFAIYYALQASIAFRILIFEKKYFKAFGQFILILLMVAVVIFGISVKE